MILPTLPAWTKSLPGVIGFKGGVARNALLESTPYQEEKIRDIDLIWWLPENLLREVDETLLEGGGFKPATILLESLERLEAEGYDVEVWPRGEEEAYFWSRDLNVNMVWCSQEGEVRRWERLGEITEIWTCSESPSIREMARCLLMSIRLGLPHTLEDWQVEALPGQKQTWICYKKAEEMGVAQEFCDALGCHAFIGSNLTFRSWD